MGAAYLEARSKIKMNTLIFDLDDTLVVEEASAQAAFFKVCDLATERYGVDRQNLYHAIRETCRSIWHKSPARSYCLQIGISSWEGLWAEFHGPDENLHVLREWAPTYRRNSWLEALRKFGVDDASFASELGEAYVLERRRRHVVFDDVVPALEHFRPTYSLGLLTNGSPDLQRRKINASGLGAFFDQVVISGEVGLGKPDVRIFELALSRLNVSADNAVMIGNSLKSDVYPAQAIGMKTVWVNRDGKSNENAVLPDAEVSNLMELKRVFEQLDAGDAK